MDMTATGAPPTLADLPATTRAGWPWNESPPSAGAAMPDGTPWPRITLVTPSYNQGPYLEACLRSVLLQGYPNLEYLVFDGGSDDDSPAIIARYAPWLSHWQSAPDDGQCAAINAGLARATGSIAAWLNSDDVLAPGALLHVAQRLAGKRMALLVGGSVITASAETLNGRPDLRQPAWADLYYDAATFPQPSVFWTADLWAAAGPLDPDLYLLMDTDLWLRMGPHVRETVRTQQLLSYQRTHADQKSLDNTRSEEFQRDRVRIMLRAARLRGESGMGWLARSWGRTARRGIATGKLFMLKGNTVQRRAARVLGANRLRNPY